MAKKVVSECCHCKKAQPKTICPPMGPLPTYKITFDQVFSVTHINLCGPFMVKDSVHKRSHGKCWAAVFVCGITTAVNVQLTADYSKEGLCCTLRRFTLQFGGPKVLVCDSGKQLTACREMVKEWLTANAATWHIVPPSAQHYNGTAERCIALLKNQLPKTILATCPTVLELQTLWAAATATVNTRPIGVTTGKRDLSAVDIITPLMLMTGLGLAPQDVDECQGVSGRAAVMKNVAGILRKRIETEVIAQKLTNSKWSKQGEEINVGDVVCWKDSNPLVHTWQLGWVVDAKVSRDDVTRTVDVEYVKGNTKATTSRSVRSVAKIAY